MKESERIALRRREALEQAHAILDDLLEIGVIHGWSDMSVKPPSFLVRVVDRPEALALTIKDVNLLKVGVDAGIDVVRRTLG